MPESPNAGQLQVKMQVVLMSRDVNLEDLQKFAPGQDFPLDVKENVEVGIAINGQILGAGKLVRTGEGRIGVRILNWNL
jgi:flagellar motor switch/type III secretory pathway protein FliN